MSVEGPLSGSHMTMLSLCLHLMEGRRDLFGRLLYKGTNLYSLSRDVLLLLIYYFLRAFQVLPLGHSRHQSLHSTGQGINMGIHSRVSESINCLKFGNWLIGSDFDFFDQVRLLFYFT